MSAERVLDTMNFDVINDKPMRMMWCQRDPSLRKSGAGNIFIKNLEKSLSSEALLDIFSPFGFILSCKVSDVYKTQGLYEVQQKLTSLSFWRWPAMRTVQRGLDLCTLRPLKLLKKPSVNWMGCWSMIKKCKPWLRVVTLLQNNANIDTIKSQTSHPKGLSGTSSPAESARLNSPTFTSRTLDQSWMAALSMRCSVNLVSVLCVL